MPFIVTVPPSTTLTLSSVRVLAFTISTDHETVTVKSPATSDTVAK